LLADKVIELGYCEEISSTHIGNILKNMRWPMTLTNRWFA
jgi:hypothetical protein